MRRLGGGEERVGSKNVPIYRDLGNPIPCSQRLEASGAGDESEIEYLVDAIGFCIFQGHPSLNWLRLVGGTRGKSKILKWGLSWAEEVPGR